jgi:hypothetical protein
MVGEVLGKMTERSFKLSFKSHKYVGPLKIEILFVLAINYG